MPTICSEKNVANDDSKQTLEQAIEFVQANQTELEASLSKSGAVLFKGFPLNNAEKFDAFSACFGYPNFTYQESLLNAIRINFTDRVFTANECKRQVRVALAAGTK